MGKLRLAPRDQERLLDSGPEPLLPFLFCTVTSKWPRRRGWRSRRHCSCVPIGWSRS